MRRPNKYSKPLEGVRTESYHPSELDTQYAKDLNKYIDYLEGKAKNISSNTILCDENCTKKCSCGADLYPQFYCNICDNDE